MKKEESRQIISAHLTEIVVQIRNLRAYVFENKLMPTLTKADIEFLNTVTKAVKEYENHV